MSLCDTRKAMKMGATNVEKRSLKTKHLAPIFRAVVMSLCDTRKAMKMGATNVENRSLKTKHLAPIFRAELYGVRFQAQHQRSAGLGAGRLVQNHQHGGRVLHRAPEAEPESQRHAARPLRRDIAQVK